MGTIRAARRGLVAIGLLGVVGLGAAAHAGDMQAHVDPATGALRPEGPPLPASGPSALPAPLVEENAPGGGRMVRLHGQYASTTTIRIDPDGTEHTDCVTTAEPDRP